LENTTRDGDDDNVDEVMKELDFLMLKSGTAESETNVNSLGANGMGNTSAEGDDDIVLESEIDETASQGDEVDENAVASAGARVADILTSLAAQSSRAHVDAMALEFVRFNNKATIARTIKFFKSEISIHDHYLLPFYARFLATIDPVFPEITKGVLEYLDSYFKWLHKRRKAANLESRRMFNIRFISELTKFNLVPKIMILNKLLLMIEHLDSFNIGNIFALFEGCGRFLMRKPDTHPVLVKLLKLLEQKKNAKYFSPEEKTMLDGAVSFLNPPKAVVNVKERPVIELYIRQLIYKDLDRDTADAVLLQLRRMDWDDPDAYRVLLKVFSKIHKVKYSNIPYMAGFLKFLEPYYPSFAVHVVDRLMENIRRGVEVFNFEAKQRRISEVSFLGCLSDCQLVDTELLFDTLFMLVQFGYPQNQPRPDYYNELDPPGDFFRIRLVCSLLEATVDSIDRTNKRWDLFINFFQYYIYTKNTLSMDIEFQIHDTFEMLGISLVSDITSAALALRGALARYRGIEIPVSGDAASEGNEGSLQPSEVVVDDKQRRMEEAKRREEARIAKVARQDAKAVSDLEKEFQMVMAERLDRKADKKATVFDEPVPTLTHTDLDTGATVQSSSQEGRVGFMLLTKKGARLQTRSVQVPSNIKFVSSVEEERARLQKEQDKIRNIVLNYDYTESKQAPIRRIVQPMIPSVKYTRRKKLDANSIPDDL
jgi:regulator of nonsense transcripts 2